MKPCFRPARPVHLNVSSATDGMFVSDLFGIGTATVLLLATTFLAGLVSGQPCGGDGWISYGGSPDGTNPFCQCDAGDPHGKTFGRYLQRFRLPELPWEHDGMCLAIALNTEPAAFPVPVNVTLELYDDDGTANDTVPGFAGRMVAGKNTVLHTSSLQCSYLLFEPSSPKTFVSTTTHYVWIDVTVSDGCTEQKAVLCSSRTGEHAPGYVSCPGVFQPKPIDEIDGQHAAICLAIRGRRVNLSESTSTLFRSSSECSPGESSSSGQRDSSPDRSPESTTFASEKGTSSSRTVLPSVQSEESTDGSGGESTVSSDGRSDAASGTATWTSSTTASNGTGSRTGGSEPVNRSGLESKSGQQIASVGTLAAVAISAFLLLALASAGIVCCWIFRNGKHHETADLVELVEVDDDERDRTPVAVATGGTVLTFSEDGGPVPVDAIVERRFVVENSSGATRWLRLDGIIVIGKYEIQFRFMGKNAETTDGAALCSVGKNEDVKVSCMLKFCCTTKIKDLPVMMRSFGSRFEALATLVPSVKTVIVASISASAMNSTKLDPDDITMDSAIGRGGFGTVFSGTYRGSPVAVKVIGTEGLEISDLAREAKMMCQLRSAYIVTLTGTTFVGNEFWIVSELMPLGSLGEMLQNERNGNGESIPARSRLKLALDCAIGMNYLHGSGMIHRDLKPDNVMLYQIGSTAGTPSCKICDFGTARWRLQCGENKRYTKGVGTPSFMAPELLSGESIPKYSELTDVYSFAVLLYELFSGTEAYSTESFQTPWKVSNFVMDGKRLSLDQVRPPGVSAMIERCWSHEPEQRSSFDTIAKELEMLVRNAAVK